MVMITLHFTVLYNLWGKLTFSEVGAEVWEKAVKLPCGGRRRGWLIGGSWGSLSIKSPWRGGSKARHGPESSFPPFKAEPLTFQCPRAYWTQGRDWWWKHSAVLSPPQEKQRCRPTSFCLCRASAPRPPNGAWAGRQPPPGCCVSVGRLLQAARRKHPACVRVGGPVGWGMVVETPLGVRPRLANVNPRTSRGWGLRNPRERAQWEESRFIPALPWASL